MTNNPQTPDLTITQSVAIFNTYHLESAQELMSRAYDAMYHAKNNNKKNIAIVCHKCGSGQESKKF